MAALVEHGKSMIDPAVLAKGKPKRGAPIKPPLPVEVQPAAVAVEEDIVKAHVGCMVRYTAQHHLISYLGICL